MRGHNICFHWNIRKLALNYPHYPLLPGALPFWKSYIDWGNRQGVSKLFQVLTQLHSELYGVLAVLCATGLKIVEKTGSVPTDIQHKMGCCREMTDNGKSTSKNKLFFGKFSTGNYMTVLLLRGGHWWWCHCTCSHRATLALTLVWMSISLKL